MWVLLAICSALFLGFYDISKKRALQQSDVISVLTGSVTISAAILCIPLLLSYLMPQTMGGTLFYVPMLSARGHAMVFLKSCIVLSSWVFAYISVKHLPLSLVSPMQATRPMWTLLGAMLLFGERLNAWQWAGVVCALGSIFIFSIVEKKVPHAPHTDTPTSSPTSAHTTTPNRKYYICLLLAILIGSVSGLYDKYMMRHYDHNAVQVYYTIYQSFMMLTVYLAARWKKQRPTLQATALPTDRTTRMRQGLSVASISVFLVLSDYVYMLALSDPMSMIAVVSTIRRGGTIIPFLYGIFVLKEQNAHRKILCLIGIIAGLLFLAMGSI